MRFAGDPRLQWRLDYERKSTAEEVIELVAQAAMVVHAAKSDGRTYVAALTERERDRIDDLLGRASALAKILKN